MMTTSPPITSQRPYHSEPLPDIRTVDTRQLKQWLLPEEFDQKFSIDFNKEVGELKNEVTNDIEQITPLPENPIVDAETEKAGTVKTKAPREKSVLANTDFSVRKWAFDFVHLMPEAHRTKELRRLGKEIKKETRPELNLDKIASAIGKVLAAQKTTSGRARHEKYNEALEDWVAGFGLEGEKRKQAETSWKKAGTIYPLRSAFMSMLNSAIPGIAHAAGAGEVATVAAEASGLVSSPAVTGGVFTMPVLSVCDLLRGAVQMPKLHPSFETGDEYHQIRKELEENTRQLTKALAAGLPKQRESVPLPDNVVEALTESKNLQSRYKKAIAVTQRKWKAATLQGPVRGIKAGVAAVSLGTGKLLTPPVAVAASVGSAAVLTAASMVAARYDEVRQMYFMHRMNMKYAIPYVVKPEVLARLEKGEMEPGDIGAGDLIQEELGKLTQGPAQTRKKYVESVVMHTLDKWDARRMKLDRKIETHEKKKADARLGIRKNYHDYKLMHLKAERELLKISATELKTDWKKAQADKFTKITVGGQVEALLLSDANLVYEDVKRKYAKLDEWGPEIVQQLGYYMHGIAFSFFGANALPMGDSIAHWAQHTHAPLGETLGIAGASLALGEAGSACYAPTSNVRTLTKTQLKNEAKKWDAVRQKQLLEEGTELRTTTRNDWALYKAGKTSTWKLLKKAAVQLGKSVVAGVTEPVGMKKTGNAYAANKSAAGILAARLNTSQPLQNAVEIDIDE
jgi:hypothetical protein